ncbi:alpha/beta hydrolase-fold protein [Alpinimonas psychrophila]
MEALVLDLNISFGAFPVAVYVVSLVIMGLLILHSLLRGRRDVVWLMIAAVAGLFAAWLTLWITVDTLNTFGGPLDPGAYGWIYAGFAGLCVALRALLSFRGWGKIIPALGAVLFLVSATLGVNAAYGLTPTLASFLHISTSKIVVLPAVTVSSAAPQTSPLYVTWNPPADMPRRGLTGIIAGGIPNEVSHFPARPAQIYLPPAALVANPPKLPVVVLMMGEPGDPDPTIIARTLETFAAKNKGLAPIVVVVDQLSKPTFDPLCLDGPRGNVDTYVARDVVPWISANLNVSLDRKDWTFAGFSNGGGCAAYFGAKYPETWGNILDVSGIEFAGLTEERAVLKEEFGGDQKAYDAIKPINIMAGQTYADTVAIFTTGELDSHYGPGQEAVSKAAAAAGMTVTFKRLPGVTHNNTSLILGLPVGFDVLFPRFGLSAPVTK